MPCSNRFLDRCRALALIPTLLLPTAGGSPLHVGDVPALPPPSWHRIVPPEPVFDCNQNGIEDSVDIAVGTSNDANWNAIPDECEDPQAPGSAETASPPGPEVLGYDG